MQKTAVLNVVGLTQALINTNMPFLRRWAADGALAPIEPLLPAVTCSAQASYLTGLTPREHGIVGNGWYNRDHSEIQFWRQSNHLVQGRKIWDTARELDATFTCANLFWWFNMYSSVDIAVTPRPMYPADGRKIPDIYTKPASLRTTLQNQLGPFPLFNFWGPGASILSSQWIASAAKAVETAHSPTLTLIYLPHLDYNLQRLGPQHPHLQSDLAAVDSLCADLIQFYEERSTKVVVLSEYGIAPVQRAIPLNRILREKGYLAIREELGLELLDAGASSAFAVVDHQIAHIYIADKRHLPSVRALLEQLPGVDAVLGAEELMLQHLAHPRCGDLVAVASSDAWFSYYYWLDDKKAPDFARTVDIHRKPGYDPVELFIDPAIRWPRLKIAKRLAQKHLGFRYLMDVIPLDDSLVRGSHGRIPDLNSDMPVFISREKALLTRQGKVHALQVHNLILAHLLDRDFDDSANFVCEAFEGRSPRSLNIVA